MMLSVVFVVAALGAAPQDPTAQPSTAAPVLQAAPAETPAVSPGAAQAAIEAGIAAFKRRRFAEAEAAFSKALEADPQSAAACFYLGYTQYKLVEPKRPFHPDKQSAAELFAKAYELDPTFRPAW